MYRPKPLLNTSFRTTGEIYDKVKEIAEAEQRSIGQVLGIMVAEQVKRYNKGGWEAVFDDKV